VPRCLVLGPLCVCCHSSVFTHGGQLPLLGHAHLTAAEGGWGGNGLVGDSIGLGWLIHRRAYISFAGLSRGGQNPHMWSGF
jgi:hypothetical protein